MNDFPTYETVLPCGCSLATGRCSKHRLMMVALQGVYRGHRDEPDLFRRVGNLMDGFGAPGENYGDWSAWRDASVKAIEAGYALTLGKTRPTLAAR